MIAIFIRRFSRLVGFHERTDMLVGRAVFLNRRVAAKRLRSIKFIQLHGRTAGVGRVPIEVFA
jgi:hypothetical protein